MDRLPAVVLLALAACEGGGDVPPPPPRKRFDAVAAAPKKAADTAGFCDERPNQSFAWPETVAPAPAGTGWRWVNLWATWCGPCVEEMPRLTAWEAKLSAEGAPVDVQFLNADASEADVAKFRTAHPNVPDGPRMKDATGVTTWLPTIGVKTEAALPVQLFVNPEGVVTCARMGALSDNDYENVKAVLEGK